MSDAVVQRRRDAIIAMFDAERLPDYMLDGVLEYVLHGRESGGFLMALFAGDFMGAACNADAQNRACFHGWMMLLWDALPKNAWGSMVAVDRWTERGGLVGKPAKTKATP